MHWYVLALVCLLIGCAPKGGPNYTYTPMFTIPFARGSTMTVNDPTVWSAELHAATYVDVVAPQHGRITDARVGSLTLRHWDVSAILLMDDLEVHWMDPGDTVCAGDTIGRTRHARIRAFWGEEETTDQSDISMVRVIRNSVITDLSDARVADQVWSALSTSTERSSDVDNAACPYVEGEE